MTTPQIQELDEKTVERIAAGEVVERPASAVKELVENSIDADASRVTVAVEAGGTGSIRVTDDGVGMSEAALRRAVEKHTTSKIEDIDDLEGGVATLGFRGEALHAIGAVSRLTITSRPRDGDSGTELTFEGGDVTNVSPAGCPVGTTVEVEDLFYNVPARRKYLKQDATEFAHVNTVVTNYALANPDVAVTLKHDSRETFATTGTGDLQETVMSVYGREVAESMIEVADGDLPEGPLTSIGGLVSHPETNRASREYLSTFVNGRYVTANAVREAVVEAYGGQLAADRYPFAVLFLEVDPATVDVNVHPRKLEVRFASEEEVRRQIESAVESALLREGLIRTSAPRGRSAPDETTITPGDDVADEQDEEAETSGERADKTSGQQGTVSGSRARDRGDGRASPGGTSNHADSERSAGSTSTGSEGEGEPEPTTVSANRAESAGHETRGGAGETEPEPTTPSTANDNSSESAPGRHRTNLRTKETEEGDHRKFRGGGEQTRLGGDDEQSVEFESLPSMRLLGQLQETYVVAETSDGLVLIDQHAADERINYERLRERFEGETTTQALADPVQIELTAREAELFDAHTGALARLGFRASLVDDRTVEVTTVPALVAETAGPELIRDVLSEFVGGDAAAAETVEAAVDELLADLACYPSITGNTSLTEGSIVDLLATLDDCENPYACPHGRPVVVELDTDELEARFERDYPGHGG
jgi:DNA mismatch repair protein MutL